MSEEPETPAVAGEPGASAPAGSPDVSPPDVEDLLKEFDDAKPAPPSSPPPAAKPAAAGTAVDPQLEARLRVLEAERSAEKVDAKMRVAISAMREDDALANLPDAILEGLVYREADRDGRFAKAFMEADVSGVRKLATALARREMRGDAKKDTAVTTDRAAMRQSLSGVGTKPPEEKSIDIWSMTPQQFQDHKRSLPR